MTRIHAVADYGDLCGEGPLWDYRTQEVYWTDLLGDRMCCFDWAAQSPRIVQQGFEVCGFTFNASGGFVVINLSGFWLWDGKGKPRLITAEADGHRCRLNDCIADPAGRVLAGSKFYDPEREYPLACLISLEKNGKARVLDEGFHLSNGLGFSPDGKTLYFTDSITRMIYAYDYNAETGESTRRRDFVKVPKTSGIPDGLTVDAEGFVWSAEWYGSCVVRYDPDGRVERRIETPAKQTSAVTFGGPDLSDIFITSAGQTTPMPIMPPGYDPYSGTIGGALYHLNLEIQGKKEFLSDIKLLA